MDGFLNPYEYYRYVSREAVGKSMPKKRPIGICYLEDHPTDRTRWCPSSLAFSWFISTITRVYGGYIYSYWDYKPTYNWEGTTLWVCLKIGCPIEHIKITGWVISLQPGHLVGCHLQTAQMRSKSGCLSKNSSPIHWQKSPSMPGKIFQILLMRFGAPPVFPSAIPPKIFGFDEHHEGLLVQQRLGAIGEVFLQQ